MVDISKMLFLSYSNAQQIVPSTFLWDTAFQNMQLRGSQLFRRATERNSKTFQMEAKGLKMHKTRYGEYYGVMQI